MFLQGCSLEPVRHKADIMSSLITNRSTFRVQSSRWGFQPPLYRRNQTRSAVNISLRSSWWDCSYDRFTLNSFPFPEHITPRSNVWEDAWNGLTAIRAWLNLFSSLRSLIISTALVLIAFTENEKWLFLQTLAVLKFLRKN